MTPTPYGEDKYKKQTAWNEDGTTPGFGPDWVGFEEYLLSACGPGIDKLVSISGHMSRIKGFHDVGLKPAERIALMHEELSEALWALRHGRPDSKKIPEFENLEEELADAVIRICDFCAKENLDLSGAICAKLAHNATRPKLHGKEF